MKISDVDGFRVSHNLKDEAEDISIRSYVVEGILFGSQII